MNVSQSITSLFRLTDITRISKDDVNSVAAVAFSGDVLFLILVINLPIYKIDFLVIHFEKMQNNRK